MDAPLRVIAIIDDTAEDRLACRRYLRQDAEWRYEFVEAESGERALEMLRTAQPDCILLDYRLPDLDGLEVLAAVTDSRGEVPWPVVMLTGADEVALAVEVMKAGAQDFINKNRLTPIDLQRAVRNAIDRVALRREVRDKELRFRTLTEAIPQLVWTSRADGDYDYLSTRWFEYTGQATAESLGRGWLTALHPEDAARTRDAWAQALAAGSDYEVEFRLRRADGQYRWHLARALPIRDESGNLTRWFGTCTDIEERKQSEREREEMLRREQQLREQAETANRLKDEFLSLVSHELRTPLNSILGWSKLLHSGKLDAPAALRAVEVVERSAQAQAQIIEDLLDVSRIVSGKLRLEFRPVSLHQVIEAAFDVVRPAAAAKGVELLPALARCNCIVSGDETRLQQAVWNLLSNAIKFTPKGGRVQVTLARINSHVEITVSDTGQGIAPEFLPHVFDRFRQGDASTTRRFGGLGLGLSIVKHVAEMHGGGVTADSAGEGQGACFKLSLPLAETRPAELRSALASAGIGAEAPQRLRGLTVLVLDDEPDARDMLAALLSAYGAAVTTAPNVAEAVETLRSCEFSVLLSDIAMPDENGYVFIRQARAMGIHTPAVAVTAYDNEEDKRQALAAGFQAHLAKPVEPSTLIALLTRLSGTAEMNTHAG